MNSVGIESINIYGSSLALSSKDLALARNKDPQTVAGDYLIDRRSIIPLWEDVITLAANAAAPLLSAEIASEIGLLVVGTESSVDYGKPISTNLLEILNLPSSVRNYETKHACYSGMAAITSAISWVKSGLNRGRKALVICSDFSRQHLNLKEEFVLGGLAAAVIISETPRIVEYEFDAWGCWSTNIYDTFRPTAIDEVGNNEVSLFSYLDALEGSFEDYQNQLPQKIDIDSYFSKIVFHTPFAGMAFQAYRTLCRIAKKKSKTQLKEDFEQFVRPALSISRQVGSCYGASNLAGIVSIILADDQPLAGTRIGCYAYGSGAIGEFYSVKVLPEAHKLLAEMQILSALDGRSLVSVADYELIERQRECYIDAADYIPDTSAPAGIYQQCYTAKKRCVLTKIERFCRSYEWS